MILEPGTVKGNIFDAFFQSAFSDSFTQVIAPNGSEVLVAASTVEKAIAEQLKYTGNKDAAAAVGKAVAERALEKGIKDL